MRRGRRWILMFSALVALLAHAGALKATALIFGKVPSTSTTENPSGEAVAAGGSNAENGTAEVENTTDGPVGSDVSTKPTLTGIPQIDYIWDPNLPRELNGFNLSDYPFYNAVPKPEEIDFRCDGLHDGFYASVKHKCQLYHHCLFGVRYDFLCANFTAFDQKTFICHFVSEVDCKNSPKYYHRNDALYKAASETTTTTSTTTTTTTTTPAPSAAQGDDAEYAGGRPRGPRPRRPYRRRRPDYYYYDDDDLDDDDYFEERMNRRRNQRPRPRRPDYDDYEDRPYSDDDRHDKRPHRPRDDEDDDRRKSDRGRNRNRPGNGGSSNGDEGRRYNDDDRRYDNDDDRHYNDDERNERRKINGDRRRPGKDDRRAGNGNRRYNTDDRRSVNDDRRHSNDRRASSQNSDDTENDRRSINGRRRATGDRRTSYDDEDEINDRPRKRGDNDDTEKSKPSVRPSGSGGTLSSLFERPRAPPKIARPVPFNEKKKFEYSGKKPTATTTSTTTPPPSAPPLSSPSLTGREEEYYDDDEYDDPRSSKSSQSLPPKQDKIEKESLPPVSSYNFREQGRERLNRDSSKRFSPSIVKEDPRTRYDTVRDNVDEESEIADERPSLRPKYKPIDRNGYRGLPKRGGAADEERYDFKNRQRGRDSVKEVVPEDDRPEKRSRPRDRDTPRPSIGNKYETERPRWRGGSEPISFKDILKNRQAQRENSAKEEEPIIPPQEEEKIQSPKENTDSNPENTDNNPGNFEDESDGQTYENEEDDGKRPIYDEPPLREARPVEDEPPLRDTRPVDDEPPLREARPVVRVVKRPFLPSRGGSPYLPRGLQPVGNAAKSSTTDSTPIDMGSTISGARLLEHAPPIVRDGFLPQGDDDDDENDNHEPQQQFNKPSPSHAPPSPASSPSSSSYHGPRTTQPPQVDPPRHSLESIFDDDNDYDVTLNDALNPTIKPLVPNRNYPPTSYSSIGRYDRTRFSAASGGGFDSLFSSSDVRSSAIRSPSRSNNNGNSNSRAPFVTGRGSSRYYYDDYEY